MNTFFSDNSAAFVSFEGRYLQEQSDPVAKACSAAINLIFSEVKRYDRICTFMPEYSGEVALKAIRSEGKGAALTHLLYFLTACVREVTMMSSEVRGFERDVLDRFGSEEVANDPSWGGWYSHYRDWIFNLLPYRKSAGLVADLADVRSEIDQAGAKIKQESAAMAKLAAEMAGEIQASASSEKESMLGDLKLFEERIEGYRAELEKHAKSYNFVNLSEAFKQLIGVKSDEVERYALGVGVAGFMALAAPVAAALIIRDGALGLSVNQAWSALATIKFVGLVGIELVLLYYFRITLKSFLLAKEQHANLSLRLALCQFIDGYCDFAGRTKEKGVSVMKGFEDLIFSPLPSHDSSLPPTIDGMDGIVKIAAALRPAKP